MRPNERGFSLIELSLLLLVGGLVMSGVLYAMKAQEEAERKLQHNFAFTTVADALSNYVAKKFEYPCPSRLTAKDGDADFGRAMDCQNGQAAGKYSGYAIVNTPGGRIRIGGVPFKTLNIGEDDAVDTYGNRLFYAVTEYQTEATTFQGQDTGVIRLSRRFVDEGDTDGDGNRSEILSEPSVRDSLDFVFFSTGRDGRGGFTRDGISTGVPCTGPAADVENCDWDADFRDYPVMYGVGGNYFDDKLEFELWSWIYLWNTTSIESDNLYNRNQRFIAVGNNDTSTWVAGSKPYPTEKLHVFGGNLLVEDDATQDIDGDPATDGGNLVTNAICDEDKRDPGTGTGNCFPPEKLGGQADETIHCKNSFMAGVANADANCVDVFGRIGNGGCGGDGFVTGFQVSGSKVNLTCADLVNGTTTNELLD